MQTSTFDTPALYGDHHVTEVRKQLLSLPGVQEVYASSAFRVVEVTYDELLVTHSRLMEKLDELGYLSDLHVMTETGVAAQRSSEDGFFRQSVTYDNLKGTVSFRQRTQMPHLPQPVQRKPGHSNGANGRRALWNCPGIGIIKPSDN